MTIVTQTPEGDCIQVTMQDQENFVRIHIHPNDPWSTLVGMVVKSATLGTLYEVGRVVEDCAVE